MKTGLEDVDPTKYVELKEEYEEKRDDFMCKHLRREWPKRIVCAVGLLQLFISLYEDIILFSLKSEKLLG
jgi:hypothetical protein